MAKKKQTNSNEPQVPQVSVKKEQVEDTIPIQNQPVLQRTAIEALRTQFHPELKFPVFSNDADLHPLEWLFKVERLFKLCKTPEDQKVDLASYYLEGRDAFDWLILYEREFPVESSSWTHFVEKFLTRFVGYADINAAMLRLKQEVGGGEVVEAYITEFVRLVSVASKKWNDNQVKGFFTNGLQKELRDEVRLYKPETFSGAIELALALKEKPQPNVLKDGDFIPQLPRYEALFMGKTRIKWLITSGSHNFIGPNVLKGSDKRLIIKESDPLMVHPLGMSAIGNLTTTVGRVNAQVNLQGFKYTADFYILPKLQGCDMMIGRAWYDAIESWMMSPDGNSFKAKNGKEYPLTVEKHPPGTITQPCSMSLMGIRKSGRV